MVRDKEHGNIGRQYNGNCAKSKLNYSYLVNAGTLKVEKKIYWVNDKQYSILFWIVPSYYTYLKLNLEIGGNIIIEKGLMKP